MGDDNAIILEVLKDMKAEVGKLTTSINGLTKCSVVREDCEKYMGGHDIRIRDLEVKLGALQALQSAAIDGEELLIAKNDAVKEANGDKKELYEKLDHLDTRLESIESKLRMAEITWKTVKENPVYLSAFVVGGLTLAGVAGGRGMDLIALYGAQAFVLGVAIVALGLTFTWLGRRRAKKALKKYGFIPILLILFALQASAQDEEIVEISDYKPVMFPPEQTIKAVDIITNTLLDLVGANPAPNQASDLSGAEDGKRAYFRLWLDNVSNLTNVTNIMGVA